MSEYLNQLYTKFNFMRMCKHLNNVDWCTCESQKVSTCDPLVLPQKTVVMKLVGHKHHLSVTAA